MKIATWNVERLKHYNSLDKIRLACESVHADILILTETDTRLQPNYRYCFQTPLLGKQHSVFYRETENRVSIYTDYPLVRQHPTFDDMTSLCVELDTELGSLCVYGTIIGIYGNRHSDYLPVLKRQMEDIRRLHGEGRHICFGGDYNCSFSDNYYFTETGRSVLIDTFALNRLSLLTEAQPECIDHIAMSKDFVGSNKHHVEEWNANKELSDHKGIAVALL